MIDDPTQTDLFGDPAPVKAVRPVTNPHAFSLLHEVKRWLLANRDVGVECPACGQFAKVYRRQVNASMAAKIIGAYRLHGVDWFYMPTLLKTLGLPGRDEGGLAYWGLIEEATERREDGGKAGWWRVTNLGASYVRATTSIPKYALIYNGRVLGFDGENVYVRTALGKRFDYAELMEGR